MEKLIGRFVGDESQAVIWKSSCYHFIYDVDLYGC